MKVNWNDFKNIILTSEHKVKYQQNSLGYHLWINNDMYYNCYLSLENEIVDFENNYKSIFNIKKSITKTKGYFTEIYKTVSNVAWTEIINKNFIIPIFLKSLIISVENNHNIQVLINSENILEENIKNLWDFKGTDWEKVTSGNIKISKNLNKYLITLDFDEIRTSSIVINQKRISGNKKLRFSGYHLTYKDVI